MTSPFSAWCAARAECGFIDGAQQQPVASGDDSPYPFNTPFFIILNAAMGGNFLGTHGVSAVFLRQMTVAYVRYCQHK